MHLMDRINRQSPCPRVTPLKLSRRLAHPGRGPRPGLLGGLFSAGVSFVFAAVFIVFGGSIISTGLGFNERLNPEAGLIARLFTLGIGAVFAGAGLFPLANVLSTLRKVLWWLRTLLRLEKTTQWERDYPWPASNSVRNCGARFSTAGAVFAVGFLSFSFVALLALAIVILLEPGDRVAAVFILLMALFPLMFIWGVLSDMAPAALQWPRFGRTRLKFNHFPFVPGRTVELTWLPPQLGECRHLRFELRYIREAREWTAGPKGSTVSYVPMSYWYAEQMIEPASRVHRGQALPVRFELPPDAPVTTLSADPPKYWELTVTAKRAGLSFKARYLVPVYNGLDGGTAARAPSEDAVPLTRHQI